MFLCPYITFFREKRSSEREEDEIVSEREISIQVCMSTPQILQYTYGGNIYTSIIVVVWQAGGNETLLLATAFQRVFLHKICM